MDPSGGKEYPMKPFNRLGSTGDISDDLGPSQSQEYIITYQPPVRDANPLEIHKAVTFTVEKETSLEDDELQAAHTHSHRKPNHAWAESGGPIVR